MSVSSIGPLSHAVFRVARLHKALAGRLLRETGLHPGQELVLMTLWADGPQRQVDLGETIDWDAPTVARSLSRLERNGLVRRSPSPSDRRVLIVEATEASLALRPQVERAWTELERLTVGALSGPQQAEIREALDLLERTLQRTDG
ncbi:MarR family winged helix-turn-helix transcriptional regulator [Promicromonospora thailandica]|uniref:DNA-binding transcriptional regulator, MarR family n=1 Tax=Promicromonospora thailandica TaxID=765201 RepID=A0A9X2JYN3_9MICO|nr:MarR family winged helix-turn-helix transcriptional regulator [Promicromonospora thailandica]MCP2267393.1 DNA-binding transcriptional regulator, MarR family [Promicromonospora thailandica]BFF19586.1 MarR family transcriptional regulator [Promicromonospora thailandica]